MNTEPTQQKREYASPLRAGQSNQTRDRILEAFAEQVVDSGLKDLSVDRIAQRAGVSTRTVYHHFPNRDDLFDAVTAWLDERIEVETVLDSKDSEEFLRRLSGAFVIFDEHETMIRAQLASELGLAVRRRSRSVRRPAIESVVREAAPGAGAEAISHATSVIHCLASSEAWRSMRDESGLSGREAAEAVSWAIRCLIASLDEQASQGNREEEGSHGQR